MTNKAKLIGILNRLDDETTAEAARDEARELLSTIDPRELADLEQELVQEGMSLRQIGGLCESHMQATAGAGAQLRVTLPDDHVVAVLMEEHQYILKNLQRLGELTETTTFDHGDPETLERLREIRNIARQLIEVEPHHQREEQALFPALIARGVQGPPMMMQQEHVELRTLKHAIFDATEEMLDTGKDSWSGLVATSGRLVALLRSHIAREDNILYPMAVAAIDDEEAWAEIRRKCDEIGYTTHHPGDPPVPDRIAAQPTSECGLHG